MMFRVYTLTDDDKPGREALMHADSCANAVQWAFRNLRRWCIIRGDHTVCVFFGETINGSTGFAELAS